MTREHVIPSFIYESQKSFGSGFTGWNEAANKIVEGEIKVKDVCQDCNNGFLSNLDDYAKQLLADAGILVQNYTGSRISLIYSYDLLLRWPLKISFNSARMTGSYTFLFEPFVPYISGSGLRPKRSELVVVADMAAPLKLSEEERRRGFFSETQLDDREPINPFVFRFSNGLTRGDKEYSVRMIIIGPLVFYLLFIQKGLMPGHVSAAVRKFLKTMGSGKELQPSMKLIELPPGRKTWVDLFERQILRQGKVEDNALKRPTQKQKPARL